ncbi:hypothetical protein H9L19_03285 [Weissella diestrammenae]|uniref:WxL domain-containing protein n=1 Tax=Weissella diestrammenae TaxID=1162633 RepID=A0A7G9T721_9LACO|nr:hypothetical protein [Weissella diestrammenae]MCM0582507.1 hypothetical protein [Weissella diestrammenae]QNN75896.1 hypothetical protein H9L19_03285 [Weissella diestrammenae]
MKIFLYSHIKRMIVLLMCSTIALNYLSSAGIVMADSIANHEMSRQHQKAPQISDNSESGLEIPKGNQTSQTDEQSAKQPVEQKVHDDQQASFHVINNAPSTGHILGATATVTDTETFVAAWQNPNVSEIIVSSNFDYTYSDYTTMSNNLRTTDCIITSANPNSPVTINFKGTGSSICGLGVSSNISTTPNITIKDINFSSSETDASINSDNFKNSILWRNTNTDNVSLVGSLTLDKVSVNLSGTGYLSAFLLPGMTINLHHLIQMTTKGSQLMGGTIHAYSDCQYQGIHNNQTATTATATTNSNGYVVETWGIFNNYRRANTNQYTNVQAKGIDIDQGAKVLIQRKNESRAGNGVASQDYSVIDGSGEMNIGGTLLLQSYDGVVVARNNINKVVTQTTNWNIKTDGVLAMSSITNENTAYNGVIRVPSATLSTNAHVNFNCASRGTLVISPLSAQGQSIWIPGSATDGGVTLKFHVDSPKYCMINGGETDWTGYTTGSKVLEMNIINSNVSFYGSLNDMNNNNYSKDDHNSSWIWNHVAINEMVQHGYTQGENYFLLKNGTRYPTTGTAGYNAFGSVVQQQEYTVFEIQSQNFEWLKWAKQLHDGTYQTDDGQIYPNRQSIPYVSDETEAISDSDRYIRGVYHVAARPTIDYDNGTVTWSGSGSGHTITATPTFNLVSNTTTTDANGVFEFESQQSQNWSLPADESNGSLYHSKYQNGNQTFSIKLPNDEVETTTVKKTVTYAPPVYDLSAIIYASSGFTFKTMINTDRIILRGEDSADSYVDLMTLDRATYSTNNDGKEWTVTEAQILAHNQENPSKQIEQGVQIQFWTQATVNDESIEAAPVSYSYHDYQAHSAEYRTIAPEQKLPYIIDSLEYFNFGNFRRGMDGHFNKNALNTHYSTNIGALLVGDDSTNHNIPWEITACYSSLGSLTGDDLMLSYRAQQDGAEQLISTEDSMLFNRETGNQGEPVVNLSQDWNPTGALNEKGWFLSLNSSHMIKHGYYLYDDDDDDDGISSPTIVLTLNSTPS